MRGPRLAAVVAAALILVACAGPDVEPPSAATPPPIDEAAPPGTSTTWGVPAGIEGWELTTFDSDGIHQLRHTDLGCQVTYHQNLGAAAAAAQGFDPTATLDVFGDQLAQRVPVQEILGDVPPLLIPVTVGDEPAEFVRRVFRYRAEDGTAYSTDVAAQWFDDVELMINVSCAADQEAEARPHIAELLELSSVVGHD
ncbi:hypothetical protein [Nocardioides limicola]|uniref:hypothetical protein n=1 Tax=Nocardioides limicola TaxID=2803368 RepID=UPI00193AEFEE|nr:hypothetical protein [Nocardioides sp. DJM-14]